jgi:hypothetical protein
METSTQLPDLHNRKAKIRHGRLGKRERARMKASLNQRSSFQQHRKPLSNEGDSESDGCRGFHAVKDSEAKIPKELLQDCIAGSPEKTQDGLAALHRDIQECLSAKHSMQAHFSKIISDGIMEIRHEVETAIIYMKNEVEQTLADARFVAKGDEECRAPKADIDVKAMETSLTEMKRQMDQRLQTEREARESSVAALSLWVTGSLTNAEQKRQQLHSLAASEIIEVKGRIKELQDFSEKASTRMSEILSETKSNKDELEHLRRNITLLIPSCISPGALHDAIQHGQDGSREAMELLKLPAIPGLDVLDDNKQSLLHDAINMNLPAVAMELLKRPDFGQVNAKDYVGRTCLHLAARYGYLNLCKLIVTNKHFAELKAITTYGQTALDVAQQFDYESIVKLLQEKGV